MPTPHPTLKTFEEFLTQVKKEDEATQRYYFSQIQFAEKERARLRAKDKSYYQKKKAEKALESSRTEISPG